MRRKGLATFVIEKKKETERIPKDNKDIKQALSGQGFSLLGLCVYFFKDYLKGVELTALLAVSHQSTALHKQAQDLQFIDEFFIRLWETMNINEFLQLYSHIGVCVCVCVIKGKETLSSLIYSNFLLGRSFLKTPSVLRTKKRSEFYKTLSRKPHPPKKKKMLLSCGSIKMKSRSHQGGESPRVFPQQDKLYTRSRWQTTEHVVRQAGVTFGYTFYRVQNKKIK